MMLKEEEDLTKPLLDTDENQENPFKEENRPSSLRLKEEEKGVKLELGDMGVGLTRHDSHAQSYSAPTGQRTISNATGQQSRVASNAGLQKALSKVNGLRRQESLNSSVHSNREKDKKKIKQQDPVFKASMFNWLEPILIFFMIFNNQFFCNIFTALYLIEAFVLILFLLTKDDTKMSIKKNLCKVFLVIPIMILIAKTVYLIKLDQNTVNQFSEQEVASYQSFGIYMKLNANKRDVIDIFKTIYFDLIEVLFNAIGILLYTKYESDLKASRAHPQNEILYMHQSFVQNVKSTYLVSIAFLIIDSIFVQTIFQFVFLLMILGQMLIWACDSPRKRNMRHTILILSQYILILQLLLTFICQIPYINYLVANSDLELVCDMFGLRLHNLARYSIYVHYIAMAFCICALQVYRICRFEQRKLGPVLPQVDIVNPGEIDVNRRTESGNKYPSSIMKANLLFKGERKQSAISKLREKNLVLRKLQDDSTIQGTTIKYYNEFSPYIWIWVCRGVAFVWCYAYHDYQALIILLWIMHSTLFNDTKLFAKITIYIYLPCFTAIFLFYYVINIPRVVNYEVNLDRMETWQMYGFYKFSYPFIEVGLMFIALLPFFLLIKSKKFLSLNQEEQKMRFIEKLTNEQSSSFYNIVFLLFTSLDLICFVVIFFSGVNKIDFYHIALIFFFVAFALWPKCFKRNFIILLIYVDFFVFEKYVYTLIVNYLPLDSLFVQISAVMGFSTDYDKHDKYFKYKPKFQQWLLILVVFIQYQVYHLLSDELQVKAGKEKCHNNLKKRYPGLYHFSELMGHLQRELLILIVFIIFFIMVIFAPKTIMNWVFQIILCFFIIVYVAVGNKADLRAGTRRLDTVWNMIIYYSSLVLVLVITYQFAALPEVHYGFNLDELIAWLPAFIRLNPEIFGFIVYTTDIWKYFIVHILFFAIGVYVRKQFNQWEMQRKKEEVSQLQDENNSDRQGYFQDKEIDWWKEYMQVRFTTPYLVYKMKPLWVVFDKLSQISFAVISIFIMVLSNLWQISLSMAINLVWFIGLFMIIASKLYDNRQKEKKKYHGKATLTMEEVGLFWTSYKKEVNEIQVNMRERVWFIQFTMTLLCIGLIYPTEFIQTFRTEFPQEQTLFDYLIFYLFWGGLYHSPKSISEHGYLYNMWGYLLTLVLLVLEKSAQRWALNRYGCTEELQKKFKEIQKHIQPKEQKTIDNIIVELPEEEEKEDEDYKPKRKLPTLDEKVEEELEGESSSLIRRTSQGKKINSSGSLKLDQPLDGSMMDDSPEKANDPEAIKFEIKKWLRKKYKIKVLNGVKIVLEDLIVLFLLISAVYKDSVLGLILLAGVVLYMVRRKIRTLVRLGYIIGIVMIAQYTLALSNLTSLNNPMEFPEPFNPYPSAQYPEGQFFIPWYLKVDFLRNHIEWCAYFGLGVSKQKLNGMWIDFLIMGMLQAYFFYFNCQLFSLKYKIVKGQRLKRMFEQYCNLTNEYCNDEIIKKETKKFKGQLFIYNFYKGAQFTIFMMFHHVTIVVTLLLAILARSLISFGYIIFCLYMVYENHKFFKKDQKDFKLSWFLRFVIRTFVIVDITLQLVFQIPLNVLHDGQTDSKSWQNIIGFYDIWDMSVSEEVQSYNIMYIILKAFTYFLVSLQIQIFVGETYQLFVVKDMAKLLSLAFTKGECITYRFNNIKLKKIAKQQKEKKIIQNMLRQLKIRLNKWQVQYFGSDEDKKKHEDKGKSGEQQIVVKQVKDDGSAVVEVSEDGKRLYDMQVQHVPTILKPKPIKKDLRITPEPSLLRDDISITQGEPRKTNSVIYKEKKQKLNTCVRIYLWIKKNWTEQLIFIANETFLLRTKVELEKGSIDVPTRLEKKMAKDVADAREIDRKDDVELKEMKRTQRYLRCGNMFKNYIYLFGQMLISGSDMVCYFFMIISMMKNAGFISILYPLTVFGFALMEEFKPRKKFWYFILMYTEIIIMIKFIYQLSFWEAFVTKDQMHDFQNNLGAWHVGVHRVRSGSFGVMFGYFLPEILILFSIMCHIHKEIMIGLFYKKENDIENIEQAMQRYLKINEGKTDEEGAIQIKRNEEWNLDEDPNLIREVRPQDDDQTLTQYVYQVHKNYRKQRANSISVIYNEDQFFNSPLLPIEEFLPEDSPLRRNCISLVDQEELKRIYVEIQEREYLENELQKTKGQKCQQKTEEILYKNKYMESLFPTVKEQKPGIDLYPLTATIQFIICIYMIFFYTKMAADFTNFTDAITYNQFSGQMVIALFIQILVMILDRFLYKSRTFIAIQKEKEERQEAKGDLPLVSMERTASDIYSMSAKDSMRKNSTAINKSTMRSYLRVQLNQRKKSYVQEIDSSDEEEVERQKQIQRQLELEHTKITFSIVAKFYMQWFLLLLIHSFVFWFFPIEGNLKLLNTRYCDREGEESGIVTCNEFGQNSSLICFYILYCIYFCLAALQIRYGVPEMKKGSFAMGDYQRVNSYGFRGFMAIPFLFELKTFSDWTFTKTALDVFQWFNLSSTHAELFVSKCIQRNYRAHPVGQPIAKYMKFLIGVMGIVGIVLLIAGPLLLFSTFNPISIANPVKNALIQVNILIKQENSDAVNTINIYSNNYVSQLSYISDTQYTEVGFGRFLNTRSFDKSLIQYVKMNNFSDFTWGISRPNRELLTEQFGIISEYSNRSIVQLELYYEFDRDYPAGAQKATNTVNKNLTNTETPRVIADFNKALNLCNGTPESINATQSIKVDDFFYSTISLSEHDYANIISVPTLIKGMELVYSCQDFWIVNQYFNNTNSETQIPFANGTGLSFFTFSQKIAPSYFNYSIVTFYISVVLVLGKVLRSVLVNGSQRYFITEIPDSEQLLLICECIYIYRMQNKLDKEEELYFVMIDIMRSPEMIKQITGSSQKQKVD